MIDDRARAAAERVRRWEAQDPRDNGRGLMPPQSKPPTPRAAAARSTIEVLMYSLRRGTQALTDTNVVDRLRQLSEQQLPGVLQRLQKLKPEIALAWHAEDLAVLVHAWKRLQ